MKKTMTMAVLMAVATAARAQQNDTVVINNPKRVTIITGDSLQQIMVKGKAGDDSFVYQSTLQLVDSNYVSMVDIGRERWELLPNVKLDKGGKGAVRNQITTRAGLGFAAPTACDADVDVATFSSWEAFFTIVQWEHFVDNKEHDYFALGLGMGVKNFRMKGDRCFVKDDDGNVTTAPLPDGARMKFSRIKVFSLTSRLSYSHYFGQGFRVGFGPMVNFNTYANIKTKYKMGGEEHKRVEKSIRQRPVTVDWMLDFVIGNSFPFYVKYSPNDVLKDGGVKFRSLTFGIYL